MSEQAEEQVKILEFAGDNISEDARTLAALGHAAIILPTGSVILGLILYFTQRDKSRFAAFHGMQAVVFQLVITVLSLISLLVFGAVWLYLGYLMGTTSDNGMSWGFAAYNGFYILLLAGFGIGSIVMGLIAARRIWQGGDYRYPIVGKWIEGRDIWKRETLN